MGFFGGRTRRQRKIVESGTRVPARLVDVKRAFFGGSGSSQRNAPRGSKQTWVAELPEGGTLEFRVKSRWSPQVGAVLEAAVDAERTQGVLVLDQDDYNVFDDKVRIKEDFGASKLAAWRLRNVGTSSSEAPPTGAQPTGLDPEPAPPSLRDLTGR